MICNTVRPDSLECSREAFSLADLSFDWESSQSADSDASNVEHGKVEVGAEILLRIAREFGRTMEWLLTGEDTP